MASVIEVVYKHYQLTVPLYVPADQVAALRADIKYISLYGEAHGAQTGT